MSQSTTILQLAAFGSGVDAVCSIRHVRPDSGQAGDYLTRVVFQLNQQEVARLDLGPDFARNPVAGIHLEQVEPGDVVSASWVDTRGQRGIAAATYRG